MKPVKISVSLLRKSLLKADATIVFAYSGKTVEFDPSCKQILGSAEFAQLKKFVQHRSFKAGKKEYVYIPGRGKNLLVLAGLGKRSDVNAELLRRTAGRLQSVLAPLSVTSLSVITPQTALKTEDLAMKALAEGLTLGHYEFDAYQKPKAGKLKSVEFGVSSVTSAEKQSIREVAVLAENVFFARDIQNKKSNDVYPESFAQTAKEVGKELDIKTTILNEKKIQDLGLNLLYAVGQGSTTPPRLVLMEYRGNPQDKETTALAGKGITFDTGGINLKPSDPRAGIHEMHLDMSGAGVVLATMRAAAQLKLPVNLIGVMPLAENAIGKEAYKPGSVIKAYNGVTVDVQNTDAEGRLVLADAMAYTVKEYKPARIIDVATLTGLAVYMFGYHMAPLIANNTDMANQLYNAGEATAERLWRLPLYDEYRDDIKSKNADISNTGAPYGGTITAAAFLEKFVGKTPWAHLDIAGTGMNGNDHDYWPKGGTGFGVRLLIEYLKGL